MTRGAPTPTSDSPISRRHDARTAYVDMSGATKRTCIRCRTPFLSQGPHHRMCDRCRLKADWVSPFEPG